VINLKFLFQQGSHRVTSQVTCSESQDCIGDDDTSFIWRLSKVASVETWPEHPQEKCTNQCKNVGNVSDFGFLSG
jgi:hypothetical protein